MAKVMVLGAGSFGTALALLCHRCGHEVTVWSHREEEANQLREEREQKKLLPGVKLPQQIAFTASLQQAGQQDLLILAVPSFAVRQTARQLCPLLQSNQIVVCVAKGLEQGSFHDFSTVLSQAIPQCANVVLSGPSHADVYTRQLPQWPGALLLGLCAAAVYQVTGCLVMTSVFHMGFLVAQTLLLHGPNPQQVLSAGVMVLLLAAALVGCWAALALSPNGKETVQKMVVQQKNPIRHPVSYTHLDVYKRQLRSPVHPAGNPA